LIFIRELFYYFGDKADVFRGIVAIIHAKGPAPLYARTDGA